eukprot:Gb_38281 [translate_table: standard]
MHQIDEVVSQEGARDRTTLNNAPCGMFKMEDDIIVNGQIKRLQDEDIQSNVLEIVGPNVNTTYITCPADPAATLGIKLPFLVMIVKNLNKYFTFEIQVLDDKNVRRRFRASNFQVCTMMEKPVNLMVQLKGSHDKLELPKVIKVQVPITRHVSCWQYGLWGVVILDCTMLLGFVCASEKLLSARMQRIKQKSEEGSFSSSAPTGQRGTKSEQCRLGEEFREKTTCVLACLGLGMIRQRITGVWSTQRTTFQTTFCVFHRWLYQVPRIVCYSVFIFGQFWDDFVGYSSLLDRRLSPMSILMVLKWAHALIEAEVKVVISSLHLLLHQGSGQC